jgi:hypothetical protein
MNNQTLPYLMSGHWLTQSMFACLMILAMRAHGASDILSAQSIIKARTQAHMPFRLPSSALSMHKDDTNLNKEQPDASSTLCEQQKALWRALAQDLELKGTLFRDAGWSAIIQVSDNVYWWVEKGEYSAPKNVIVGMIDAATVTLHPAKIPHACASNRWSVQLQSRANL